jgi:hypothetical protein
MVTGAIAPVPVAALLAAAWLPPAAAALLDEPALLAAALLEDPAPELQAARAAPVAQQATVIAARVANRLWPCLPLVFFVNSLTVPSWFVLGFTCRAIGRSAVRPAAADRS